MQKLNRTLAAFMAVGTLIFAGCSTDRTTTDGLAGPGDNEPTLSGTLLVSPDTVIVEPESDVQFVATDSAASGVLATALVAWSATVGTVDSSGLFHAPSATGPALVSARANNGTSRSAVVSVENGVSQQIAYAVSTSFWIEVTPGSVTLTAGKTRQFSGAIKTSDGKTYRLTPVWSATGGTITSSGFYTAPGTAGTYKVILRRTGDSIADTATVTVTSSSSSTSAPAPAPAPAPTTSTTRQKSTFWIETQPATVSLAPGASKQFTAVGKSLNGKTYGVMVNWRATGGTISSKGMYKAPSTNGTYRVIATRQGDVQTDTSIVTVGSGGTGGGTPPPATPPATPTLSSVVVTPATAGVAAKATQQFTVAGKLSDGSTGSVSVTWSATGGTISTGGMYTAGSTAGSYRVIAVQQGGTKADTSAVTVTSAVTAPPPSGTAADPTQLPVASGQLKNVAAYAALNVPGMAAGSSYADPVTGVRVWKVTSASVPTANPFGNHEYSEGPAQISREWGTGKHTIAVSVGGGWLVDFTRGTGLSNWRHWPAGAAQLSFAKNPATPQIAYVATTGGQLRRYDTGTNSWADGGLFPAAFSSGGWFQQDKNDGWFAALGTTAGTVIVWNSQTGQSYSRSFSGLDEPYLDRDGHYVLVNASSPQIWDLSANTLSAFTPPGRSVVVHVPALRSFFILGDPNTGAGITPQWRVDPSPARANVQISTLNGYAPDEHASGMWVQTDAELGNDLTKQWWLRTSYNWSYAATGNGVNEGVAFLRADGSAFQLLLHHYSVPPTNGADNYWSEPRATLSIDGKLVMFDSNMNNSPRSEVFLAEVPQK